MNRGHYGASYDLKVGFGRGHESEPKIGMEGTKKNRYLLCFQRIFWVNGTIFEANKQFLEGGKAKKQVAFQRKKWFCNFLLMDMVMKSHDMFIHSLIYNKLIINHIESIQT